MKILRVLFFLFYFTSLISIYAQWQPLTNGPYGAKTTSIAQLNNKLFLGTDKGIFISNDDVNWSILNFDSNYYSDYSCCLSTSDSFIVASRGESVKISYDQGTNWQDISFGLSNQYPEILLANDSTIIAKANGKIYIKIRINGFWSIFNPIWSSSDGVNAISAAFNKKTILFFSNTNKLYKSINRGETWEIVPFDTTIGLYNIKCYGNNFYLCTYQGLFISTDDGATWTNTLSNYFVHNIYVKDSYSIVNVSGVNSDLLLIAFSNNNNWVQMSNDFYNHYITDFLIKENKVFIATESGGVFESANWGQSWEPHNLGLIPFKIYTFAIKNNLIFAYGNMNEGIFKSSDDGNNWTYSPLPTNNPYYLTCLFVKGNTILGTQPLYSYSYYSNNDGNNWNSLDWGGGYQSTTVLGNNLFSAGFQVSRWNENTVPYIFANSPINLKLIATIGDETNYKIIVTTLDNELYISDEQGNNWTNITTNLSDNTSNIQDISVAQNNIYIASYNNYPGISGVYKSSDYGNTWQLVLGDKYINKLFSKDNYVFAAAASFNGGIFASKDSGESFTPFNEGLGIFNNFEIRQFQISDEYIYVGLDSEDLIKSTSGIFKRKLSDIISDVENIPNIPSYFNLGQNYPNPFNPTTTINFSLPQGTFVSLKIYDVLGKEITTLVNEELPAGNYTKSFDASNYSSGIYLYKISAGKFNETKKMVLQK